MELANRTVAFFFRWTLTINLLLLVIGLLLNIWSVSGLKLIFLGLVGLIAIPWLRSALIVVVFLRRRWLFDALAAFIVFAVLTVFGLIAL